MRVSVCIITFNEAANIAATLGSVQGVADEIIVVDSGSTDSTVEIARAHRGRDTRRRKIPRYKRPPATGSSHSMPMNS